MTKMTSQSSEKITLIYKGKTIRMQKERREGGRLVRREGGREGRDQIPNLHHKKY